MALAENGHEPMLGPRVLVNCPPDTDGKLFTTASRLTDFWAMFIREMDDEDVARWIGITCKEMKSDACLTIACMLRLSRRKMIDYISGLKRDRGPSAWLHPLEGMLDHKWALISDCAPESAHLGLSFPMQEVAEEEEPPARLVEFCKPKYKLGTRLQRQGRMNELALPWAKIAAAIIETANLGVARLSCSDTRGVAREVFLYMALVWQYIAGDKIVFTHFAKQLIKHYPNPWRNKWFNILKTRFKHGRAAISRGANRVSRACHTPLMPPDVRH